MSIDQLKIAPGSPLPLGSFLKRNGVQFSIFSRHATAITLVLYENEKPESLFFEIELDPEINKTGDIWHIFIEGVEEGQLYGYRVDGPYAPEQGNRFNRHKLLVDPYARALTGNSRWELTTARGYDFNNPEKDLKMSEQDSGPYVPRGIVIGNRIDETKKPINRPQEELIIYEMHVKGFTFHESSNVDHRGTFKGVIDKIHYLQELGVNAVELMPIQEFDEYENIYTNPLTGEQLKNYWGYSTLSFFAVKGNFASSGAMGQQVKEFKDMVNALHDAGIEVILDVVYNHTAEGDQQGPTVSFRGIDNNIYYILEDNKRYYKNYSGCGNTFNCNHPLVRDFILDSLRYFVIEMNIDGFRFDLASILGRDQHGRILSNPPLIERIEEDPILRNTKIIAEAWDAAGAYQVGNFPGRWAEWNGKYRDDIRAFWRGDDNTVGIFATRVTGSEDLYAGEVGGPVQSINFVTCHDGFTLNDLVSYNYKHNIANGEGNRDGENHNVSFNFGIEGDAITTPLIERYRSRQIKNFLATLFLSQGIPMMLSGDEFRRTQKGNNNAYCQDNELTWNDWSLLEKHNDVFQFVKNMIAFRKKHPSLRRVEHFSGRKSNGNKHRDISWHGFAVKNPDWSPTSNSIALLITGEYNDDKDIFIIFHADMVSHTFELPKAPSGNPWRLIIDTAKAPGEDIIPEEDAPVFNEESYFTRKLSTVVFVA